jgi:hypothetical protein
VLKAPKSGSRGAPRRPGGGARIVIKADIRFDPILPDDDIWAAIAYIESRWPESTRRQHAKKFPRRH